MSEDLNTKSLGEKLFDARKAAKMTYIESWTDLLDHERDEHEIAALSFAASLAHDETANAVITDLRARLQAAEERAEKLEEALTTIRQILLDQGDNTCGRNCEAMYKAAIFFDEEIALIDAALKTEGA